MLNNNIASFIRLQGLRAIICSLIPGSGASECPLCPWLYTWVYVFQFAQSRMAVFLLENLAGLLCNSWGSKASHKKVFQRPFLGNPIFIPNSWDGCWDPWVTCLSKSLSSHTTGVLSSELSHLLLSALVKNFPNKILVSFCSTVPSSIFLFPLAFYNKQ